MRYTERFLESLPLVAVGSYHTSPQLVQNLVCRFVSAEPKLTLELDDRQAGREARCKVGSPKPHTQRHVRPLYDRADCERIILATLAAAQDVRAIGEAKRIATLAAPHAHKAVLPADRLHVGRASCVVWEQPLELRQAARKRQVFAGENVGKGHGLEFRLEVRRFIQRSLPDFTKRGLRGHRCETRLGVTASTHPTHHKNGVNGLQLRRSAKAGRSRGIGLSRRCRYLRAIVHLLSRSPVVHGLLGGGFDIEVDVMLVWLLPIDPTY